MRVFLTVIIAMSLVRFLVGLTRDETLTGKIASLSLIAGEIVGIVFVWRI